VLFSQRILSVWGGSTGVTEQKYVCKQTSKKQEDTENAEFVDGEKDTPE